MVTNIYLKTLRYHNLKDVEILKQIKFIDMEREKKRDIKYQFYNDLIKMTDLLTYNYNETAAIMTKYI